VQSGGLRRAPTSASDRYADDTPPGAKHGGREIVNELLVADGKARDRDAAKVLQDSMSSAEIAAYLRGKPAVDVLAVYEAGFSGMLDLPLQYADGRVLPAEPAHTPGLFADASRFQRVPVILGTNRDEEKLFMVRNPEHVEQRFGVFPRFKDEKSYMRFAAYMSDAWKVRGADDLARAMTAAGHAEVYVYRFDWDEESEVLGFDLAKALGAAHGLEIAFVFGHFAGPLGAPYLYDESRIGARDALATSMMSYWAAFAHMGAPGRGRDGKLPLWQPWGTDGHHTFVLDTPAGGGMRMTPDRLSYADLKARLLEDVTFGDRKARCAMYVRLFRDVPSEWDDAEYTKLGDGGCADVDPDDVPRR
jgi:para-nitrobenzyl esterase